MDLHFTMYGRDIKFSMHYDESFIADQHMKECLLRWRACEPEVMHVMARVLHDGDYAVDAGANIGFFTLFMSRLVGPTGRIMACEPGPNNQIKLEANIKFNDLQNVEVIYSPLWNNDSEGDEEVPFYLAEDSGVNSLRPNISTRGQTPVKLAALRTLLDKKIPRLIKLDIEGAEHHALDGLGDYIGDVPYIVCELNEAALGRFGTSRQQLRDFMIEWGYETFVLTPDGILPLMVPKTTEIVSDKTNLNVLFSTVASVAEVFPTLDIHG